MHNSAEFITLPGNYLPGYFSNSGDVLSCCRPNATTRDNDRKVVGIHKNRNAKWSIDGNSFNVFILKSCDIDIHVILPERLELRPGDE